MLPDVTFTVPVLLNSVLMVEVPLAVLVNVPALFTIAVAPVSPVPWLVAKIVSPPVVVSVNVAPLKIVSVPEPTSLTLLFGLLLFRLI